MSLSINIKNTSGAKFTVQAEPTLQVKEFKASIEGESGVPAAQQRLIYKGAVLNDERPLESYSIQDGNTIILVKSARSAIPSAAAQAVHPSVASPPTASPAPGASTGAAPANDIFAQFGGMGGSAPANNPFGALGGLDMNQMQAQLMSNPAQMQEMMQSPIMQSLMESPELIQNMFQNHPQFRDIIERNPELAHVLNDPATIRQSMQMASNPDLMREMMRNSDRAMSNLEVHPEGFNALRRMYENVQEPMMEAAADMHRSPSSAAPTRNTQHTGSVPTGAPLPNPWAAPSAAAQSGAAAAPNMNMNALLAMMGGGQQAQQQQPVSSGQQQANPFGFGAMNPEQMGQMMNNPFVQQMMQQMLSDPAQLQAMMQANPMTRQLMDSNPAMREAMANPALLQAMSNPQMIQAALTMMNQQQQVPQTFPGPAPTQGAPNPFANLSAMLGQQQAFGAAAPQPALAQPEIVYRSQLSQLNDMGFTNAAANLSALLATGGNVQAAIERLLSE